MVIRMKPLSRSLIAFLLVLTGISTAYFAGVARVPFHPDESTYLYVSTDIGLFWKNPSALFWQPEKEDDPRQRYRELNAPIVHYLLGLGRMAAGLPALPVDWDWGKTWQENQQTGALPSTALLLAGRFSVAALFPLSLLLLYLTARRVSSEATAWLAALLMASNPLVLLHTRRAMAESPLLFTTCLLLWSLVRAEQRVWWMGIPAALAFSAKQTLAALAPVGLLAAIWPAGTEKNWRGKMLVSRMLFRALAFGGLFAAVVLALNPFLWQQPISAASAAIQARQQLASAQLADRPGQELDTPGKKLIAMIGSLYMTPPMFAEAANYQEDTRSAETAYLANPLHSLFRSLAAGAILMVLNIFGFLAACRQALLLQGDARRRLLLLLAATLMQTLALLAFVPLPWQRYYLPLVPFACLWTAYGVSILIRRGFALRNSSDREHPAAHLQGM